MLEFASHQDLSAMGDMARLMELSLSSGMASLGAPMPVLQKAPEFVKQILMFPYIGGLSFVQYVRKRYPWSKIDEVYRHPPESTEQILHPEKYFAKEHPIWLKAAALPSLKPAKVVHEDTFGEEQIKVFLAAVASARNVADAAAGWGGDRMVAYDTGAGEPYTIVWLTQWDTETDAGEFATAVKPALDKLHGWSSGVHGGNQVLLLFNVAADRAPKVADEVFKNWKAVKTVPPM
jgi:hypothetical protein